MCSFQHIYIYIIIYIYITRCTRACSASLTVWPVTLLAFLSARAVFLLYYMHFIIILTDLTNSVVMGGHGGEE